MYFHFYGMEYNYLLAVLSFSCVWYINCLKYSIKYSNGQIDCIIISVLYDGAALVILSHLFVLVF